MQKWPMWTSNWVAKNKLNWTRSIWWRTWLRWSISCLTRQAPWPRMSWLLWLSAPVPTHITCTAKFLRRTIKESRDSQWVLLQTIWPIRQIFWKFSNYAMTAPNSSCRYQMETQKNFWQAQVSMNNASSNLCKRPEWHNLSKNLPNRLRLE